METPLRSGAVCVVQGGLVPMLDIDSSGLFKFVVESEGSVLTRVYDPSLQASVLKISRTVLAESWGVKPQNLSLDTQENQFLLSPKLSTLYKERKWALLPDAKTIKEFFFDSQQTLVRRGATGFPRFKKGFYPYTVIWLQDQAKDTQTVLQIDVDPKFAILHLGTLLTSLVMDKRDRLLDGSAALAKVLLLYQRWVSHDPPSGRLSPHRSNPWGAKQHLKKANENARVKAESRPSPYSLVLKHAWPETAEDVKDASKSDVDASGEPRLTEDNLKAHQQGCHPSNYSAWSVRVAEAYWGDAAIAHWAQSVLALAEL
ncbi:hypothetical protein CVT24_008665 [Panaeolus cyanescens]|uniref:Uncharacterized protein n=1 Tax=Panaeolus cyanescens TaxID=181874 RepID=A0A409WWJ9_9AGAR|nr:hypothetical protein CVT24_008665 [Panaeolus cyanescens]